MWVCVDNSISVLQSVVATSSPSSTSLSSSRQLSSSASDLHYLSRAHMQVVEFDRDTTSLHSQRLADANSIGYPTGEQSAANSRRPSTQSGLSISSSRKKRPAPPPPPPHASSNIQHLAETTPTSTEFITIQPVQLGAPQVHSRASSHSSGFDEPLARSPDSPADTLKSGASGNLSLRSAELAADRERRVAPLFSEDDHRDTESLDSATLSSTGSRSKKKRPAPVAPSNGKFNNVSISCSYFNARTVSTDNKYKINQG